MQETSSQALTSTSLNATKVSPDNITSSLEGETSHKSSAQEQQLRRLEALGAAAELSLKTLQDRLQAAKVTNSESWEKARLHKAKRKTHHRRSSGAFRRSSVVPVRRVTAANLAESHDRHLHGSRRGSIEIPIQKSSTQQHNTRISIVGFADLPLGRVGSIQEEEPEENAEESVSSSGVTFFPELPSLVADVAQRVEDLVALVEVETQNKEERSNQGQIHGQRGSVFGANFLNGDDVSEELKTSNSSATINGHIKLFKVFADSPAGHEVPKVSGYKRGTLAGPAWISPQSPGTLSIDSNFTTTTPLKNVQGPLHAIGEAETPVPFAAQLAGATADLDGNLQNGPTSAVLDHQQQPDKYEMEAAERYLKRLVGVTVEPAAERDDPFALESSDEEDPRPVMDR